MFKKLFFLAFFLTGSLRAAVGPTIECRFGALDEDGVVSMDEFVAYTLDPGLGLNGSFEPYEIDISVNGPELNISVYLEDDPISGIQLPVRNVVSLPVGASLFGVNTVFHNAVSGLVSFRYECKKAMWN
jgi:hypothetical protein